MTGCPNICKVNNGFLTIYHIVKLVYSGIVYYHIEKRFT